VRSIVEDESACELYVSLRIKPGRQEDQGLPLRTSIRQSCRHHANYAMVMAQHGRVAGPEILHRSRWRSRPNERTWLWQSKKSSAAVLDRGIECNIDVFIRVAVILSWVFSQAGVAQTATYHLPQGVSAITAADDKLLTAGPDAPAWPLRRLPAKQWASI